MLRSFLFATAFLACEVALVSGPFSSVRGAEPAADPTAAASADFEKQILPFMQQHCVRCHNADKQEGEFRIDNLSHQVGDGPSLKRWREVIEKINSDEMPPADAPNRPSAEEGNRIVDWLVARIKEGEASRLARREPVSFHRLTREEYALTVKDLLGVQYDVTDPGGLEEDPNWHGFERIGSVLSLSASHVEKYFAAAEAILAEAYPDKPIESQVVRKAAHELRGRSSRKLEELGLLDKVRVDMWPGHSVKGGRAGPGSGWFKTAGEYKVRMQLSGLKPANGRAPHVTFYADKLDRMLFEQDIVAPEEKPTVVEFQTHLPAGSHTFDVTNDVPGPSVLPRFGRSGFKSFISLKDGRIPWQLKLTDEEGLPLHPFLILDWIEWEGPLVSEEAQQKRDQFLPADLTDPEQLREKLTLFVEKAFRRPAKAAEVDRFLTLAQNEMAAGEKPLAAWRTTLLAVLCSSDFYYVVEGTPGAPSATLNDWELATRLSYFLWSSMPDEELFDLARQGRLHEREVLQAQTARMLADPRSKRFAESFSRQWLQLKKVGMFTPDSNLYPEYDKYLEQSMKRETTEFFREVFENNLTLREFLVSDWTMINPRLALHYGMETLDQDAFQRTALKPEDHRGGILTHASILSLSSDGTRHRPVHRGVWVLESIFDKPPSPPPANIEPIESTPVDAPKATVRMKLDAHKSNQNCAVCHRKIDPLGFAFDNYDAIGRWRTEEKVQGTGDNPLVDASGVLPDGRTFANAQEFQQLLLDDLDSFSATFMKKLATFGLRRAMTVDDEADLRQLAAACQASDYRVRDAVEAFILSDLFQKR
ncbi:DUF1592 domain-containing protein [Lignipirellula cremea]|uniref:Planctomycete cytochrome C n=1 Tax=Lignipirellula cremea TaxID=2528010 RepID=A0A518E5A0_9BACT|nr:DUF1592 domain-containing protein [Lignipirellula cremea]QDU99253.1 Planctomycete cytochrome C [Lignipirellula cremea]